MTLRHDAATAWLADHPELAPHFDCLDRLDELAVPLTRVRPDVVVEISADAALQAGVFRHPLRFIRVRPDLQPDDVPDLSGS